MVGYTNNTKWSSDDITYTTVSVNTNYSVYYLITNGMLSVFPDQTHFIDSSNTDNNTQRIESYIPYVAPTTIPGYTTTIPGSTTIIPRSTTTAGTTTTHLQSGLLYISSGITLTDSISVMKTGETYAWDSVVYTPTPIFGGWYLTFSIDSIDTQLIVGVSNAPIGDNLSFEDEKYAIYLRNGSATVYESGTFIGDIGSYSASDVFMIQYDGSYIKYYINGAISNTQSVYKDPPGMPFYMGAILYTPGAKLTHIFFNKSSYLSNFITSAVTATVYL